MTAGLLTLGETLDRRPGCPDVYVSSFWCAALLSWRGAHHTVGTPYAAGRPSRVTNVAPDVSAVATMILSAGSSWIAGRPVS